MGILFKDLKKLDYAVFVSSLWHQYFRMFELNEIMRERDSKVFVELLKMAEHSFHEAIPTSQ